MRQYLTGVLLCAALAACGQTSDDMREIRDGQREIRQKLADIEKKVEQMGARPAAAAAAGAQLDPNRVVTIPIGDSPVKGPQNAKVVMAEFSDFQCPFCAQVPPVIDQVLKAYPDDVKFVFKQFPLVRIHQNATPAAKAALAAHKQGKFWEMHDKLFGNQKALDADSFKKYAQEMGLDMQKFEADMNSPETQKQIDEDSKLAAASGVSGTPTLFINGRKASNRNFEGLKAMIDEALKKG